MFCLIDLFVYSSYMEKISKRDVSAVLEDNSIFAPEPVDASFYPPEGPLVRQKRSDYDDAQKWSPGYVVGTSPQVEINEMFYLFYSIPEK